VSLARRWRIHNVVNQFSAGTTPVVGWSDPEGSRQYLGALLLAYYDDGGKLIYARRAGSGISDAELERLWLRLQHASRRPTASNEPVRLAARPPACSLGSTGTRCGGRRRLTDDANVEITGRDLREREDRACSGQIAFEWSARLWRRSKLLARLNIGSFGSGSQFHRRGSAANSLRWSRGLMRIAVPGLGRSWPNTG
jgi:hypothetical protein